MIYLASKSPRRTELLQQVGVEHKIIDIEVDENINSSNSPQENVRALSVLKCQEGVCKVITEDMPSFPVLAADTIVVLKDKIFGNWFFPYFWPWLPELTIFDLKFGFLIKNCIYFTPWMYGQLPKNRFFHGFSEADLGHASLFLKLPCMGF